MQGFTQVLYLAKCGDQKSKELIIKKYYPLIVKEAKEIYLNNLSFEDIVQIGILNLLIAIERFNFEKASNDPLLCFTSYVNRSIKNGFKYLCRSNIKYNSDWSFEQSLEDGDFASMENSLVTVEDEAIKNLNFKKLNKALLSLSTEEYQLIKYLYYSNEKTTLSKYARDTGKDYYYCTCLKKRAILKLKALLI